MSDLSPAAQAVLDAATAPTGDFCLENVNEIAAAALRAAVQQCTYKDAWEDKFMSAERILAIANELEGFN